MSNFRLSVVISVGLRVVLPSELSGVGAFFGFFLLLLSPYSSAHRTNRPMPESRTMLSPVSSPAIKIPLAIVMPIFWYIFSFIDLYVFWFVRIMLFSLCVVNHFIYEFRFVSVV